MARRAHARDRPHRGDPLYESIGVAEEAVFVCHDLQIRGDAEKFTAGEQKVGTGGTADALVAGSERPTVKS